MKPKKDLRKWVLDFLKSQNVMMLATASKSARPHVATVFYLIDDDFNFYFITKGQTAKSRNIAQNRKVALTVGWAPPMCVQVSGLAKLIKDDRLKLQAMAELVADSAEKMDLWPPIVRVKGHEYRLYRITPKSIRALDLQPKEIESAESPVYVIKP